MFQWSITLSDKQVMMLVAFHVTDDDADGSRFSAVHAMIGDAWDVRAVRKLSEVGLLSIRETQNASGLKKNIWNITDKGNFIALSILEDADALKCIGDRTGLAARSILHDDEHRRWMEKKETKKAA